MPSNSFQSTRSFQRLDSKFCGDNRTVTYVQSAKFSSSYREYPVTSKIVITGLLSHTYHCDFCQDIKYSSSYRENRYIEDRYIGVPLYIVNWYSHVQPIGRIKRNFPYWNWSSNYNWKFNPRFQESWRFLMIWQMLHCITLASFSFIIA